VSTAGLFSSETFSPLTSLRLKTAVYVSTGSSLLVAFSFFSLLNLFWNKKLFEEVIATTFFWIQLWGTASNSSIEILQRFQSKTLRSILNAPWCIKTTGSMKIYKWTQCSVKLKSGIQNT
jgi:hypothetical protein